MKLRDMLVGLALEEVTLFALFFATSLPLPAITAIAFLMYYAGAAASRAIRRYIWYRRWLQQRRRMRIEAGAQIYKLEREEENA